MWLNQVSNPGTLTYESGALPTLLCGPGNAAYVLKVCEACLLKPYILSSMVTHYLSYTAEKSMAKWKQ